MTVPALPPVVYLRPRTLEPAGEAARSFVLLERQIFKRMVNPAMYAARRDLPQPEINGGCFASDPRVITASGIPFLSPECEAEDAGQGKADHRENDIDHESPRIADGAH